MLLVPGTGLHLLPPNRFCRRLTLMILSLSPEPTVQSTSFSATTTPPVTTAQQPDLSPGSTQSSAKGATRMRVSDISSLISAQKLVLIG